jgi:MEDS: MEthanogen/methylotroph, DcmR Sensory domain
MQSQFGNHNLLLYTNRDTLRNICSKYCKTALDSSSEIVLILTYYESVKDWLIYLKDNGIRVEKYKNDGSLVVIESRKGFFGLLNDFVGIMIMIRMLLRRANKLAKKGLTVIIDMGVFFPNRIEDLIKHETQISTSIQDLTVNIYCVYNKLDFESLREEQRQLLDSNHNEVISVQDGEE